MVLPLVCWSLLGQGERCEVDPRFSTPGQALKTYWEALRTEDIALVGACFSEPRQALPFPGMLWFLPPSESVSVSAVRYTAGDEGAVIATYELRFRPIGATDELRVLTRTELVRVRGEWRLTPGLEALGIPEWRPIPHRVDI